MGEKNEEQRGLIVYVYRQALGTDCTNGGVTSDHDTLTVVGTVDYRRGNQPVIGVLDKGSRVFSPTADRPAVWLVVGRHGSRDRYVIPADETGQPDERWWMAGGNLVSSSDARWCELADRQDAVRVHDRYES